MEPEEHVCPGTDDLFYCENGEIQLAEEGPAGKCDCPCHIINPNSEVVAVPNAES